MPAIHIGPEPPPYQFPIKAILFALCILGAMAVAVLIWSMTDIVYNWVHKRREKSKPVYRVRAKVLDKRTTCLSLSQGASCRQSDPAELEDTFIVFSFDGRTEQMLASDELYLRVMVGSEGWLDFRGNTAVDFKPV